MRLALYQPDIPQNCGALIRLTACLGVGLDIIEPCGFLLDDKRLKRAGLDYHSQASLRRHRSWTAFQATRQAAGKEAGAAGGRLLLLTTGGDRPYTHFAYASGDILLLGRESAGVPEEVHAAADARLVIPVQAGCRSLNVAQAAAMVLGEALRQTSAFPEGPQGPTETDVE
ncbi:tRNA (cytidine(34)-2'-O)-methyltransferase [Pelagibius sp. CAU 1746]|uniref:tRNA (cytidine(34)-2'-O)-methyltransferase n=1 Tax=Pelagibius sp. CAU 1746 TaxID=3140370 RepID=UPI00325BC628